MRFDNVRDRSVQFSGGRGIVAPNAVANLINWVEFDDLSTMFVSADATTTPVANSGDVIRTLRDKTHASNLWWKNRTSDATSPVYTVENGKRFGAFTSAASRFLIYHTGGVADTTSDTIARPTESTLICAYRKASGSRAILLGSSGNSTIFFGDELTTNLMAGSPSGNVARANAGSPAVRTSFGVGAWINRNDSVAGFEFYQDNVQLSGANQTGVAMTGTTLNVIGRQTTSYSDCDIIGWALYNRALTPAERTGVTRYFQAKC